MTMAKKRREGKAPLLMVPQRMILSNLPFTTSEREGRETCLGSKAIIWDVSGSQAFLDQLPNNRYINGFSIESERIREGPIG